MVNDADDASLVRILLFVVFFPFSAVYAAAAFVIRRQKKLTRG